MTEATQSPKEAIIAELEATRSEFHRILSNLSEEQWRQPSRNKAWTNGQVLFHMVFGFMLIPALFRLIRFYSKIPPRFSRAFAAILNFSTPLFNMINALGPRIGARAFSPKSLGRKFDKVYDAIIKRLDSIADYEWHLGMHYPSRWDPQMSEYMTFEKLFRYPIKHFNHHSAQITR